MHSHQALTDTGAAMSVHSRSIVLRALPGLAALVLTATNAPAQSFVRASVSSSGVPAAAGSTTPDVSDGGRFVAFSSDASNLVAGDTNARSDVFVRDVLNGVTTRVNVSSSGAQADGGSTGASISASGRHVVFQSAATNLVDGDVNGRDDIFVHDRQTAQTQLVTKNPYAMFANGHSRKPSISADGRFVLFVSSAWNLTIGDINGRDDVYLKDLQTGSIQRVSVDAAGYDTDDASDDARLSTDANSVVFTSAATNIVAGDTNGKIDVFVRDLALQQTTRVSVSSAGVESNQNCTDPVISADGRFVAFASGASNLAPYTTNGIAHAFLHDRALGTTVRLDVNTSGNQPGAAARPHALSIDGRYAYFTSLANNLVAGDTNNKWDLFARDLVAAQTLRLTLSTSGGSPNGDSTTASLSSDERYVALSSIATNLIPGDVNGVEDVFLRSATPPYTEYHRDADGDGFGDPAVWVSEASAPVGYVVDRTDCDDSDPGVHPGAVEVCDGHDNDCDGQSDEGCITYYCTTSTTTNGCNPQVYAAGFASPTSPTPCFVVSYNVEGLAQGLVFYGLAPTATPWAPASTSTKCVASPIQRTGIIDAGGTGGQCDGQLLLDLNDYLRTHPGGLGAPFPVGQHLYAQAWFRDSAAPKGTNLSDAVDLVLGP